MIAVGCKLVESIEASIASEGARQCVVARKDDAKLRVMFVPAIIGAARGGREATEQSYVHFNVCV